MNSKLAKSITQLFIASVILACVAIVVSQWLDRRFGPVTFLGETEALSNSASQFDAETQKRIAAEKQRQKYEQRVNIHLWKLWEQLEREHQLELQKEKLPTGKADSPPMPLIAP